MIGGGLAGLASAVALAEAGLEVQLLEKRPHLGGRATSYTLPDGTEVDNCQHVTLGCCTNLADFYRRAGAGGKIRFYDRLYFVDRKGRRSTMEASTASAAAAHGAFVSFLRCAQPLRTSGASPGRCWPLRGRAAGLPALTQFRCSIGCTG